MKKLFMFLCLLSVSDKIETKKYQGPSPLPESGETDYNGRHWNDLAVAYHNLGMGLPAEYVPAECSKYCSRLDNRQFTGQYRYDYQPAGYNSVQFGSSGSSTELVIPWGAGRAVVFGKGVDMWCSCGRDAGPAPVQPAQNVDIKKPEDPNVTEDTIQENITKIIGSMPINSGKLVDAATKEVLWKGLKTHIIKLSKDSSFTYQLSFHYCRKACAKEESRVYTNIYNFDSEQNTVSCLCAYYPCELLYKINDKETEVFYGCKKYKD